MLLPFPLQPDHPTDRSPLEQIRGWADWSPPVISEEISSLAFKFGYIRTLRLIKRYDNNCL